MSAPAVDLFEDRHHAPTIERVERTIDFMTTAGIAIGIFAAGAWGVAIATVRLNADEGGTILVVSAAAAITVVAALCWCTATIRHYNRRLAEATCHRIEQDLDLYRRADRLAGGTDVDNEMRAYIAGRIDREA